MIHYVSHMLHLSIFLLFPSASSRIEWRRVDTTALLLHEFPQLCVLQWRVPVPTQIEHSARRTSKLKTRYTSTDRIMRAAVLMVKWSSACTAAGKASVVPGYRFISSPLLSSSHSPCPFSWVLWNLWSGSYDYNDWILILWTLNGPLSEKQERFHHLWISFNQRQRHTNIHSTFEHKTVTFSELWQFVSQRAQSNLPTKRNTWSFFAIAPTLFPAHNNKKTLPFKFQALLEKLCLWLCRGGLRRRHGKGKRGSRAAKWFAPTHPDRLPQHIWWDAPSSIDSPLTGITWIALFYLPLELFFLASDHTSCQKSADWFQSRSQGLDRRWIAALEVWTPGVLETHVRERLVLLGAHLYALSENLSSRVGTEQRWAMHMWRRLSLVDFLEFLIFPLERFTETIRRCVQ